MMSESLRGNEGVNETPFNGLGHVGLDSDDLGLAWMEETQIMTPDITPER
jgi:hypothetical protein